MLERLAVEAGVRGLGIAELVGELSLTHSRKRPH